MAASKNSQEEEAREAAKFRLQREGHEAEQRAQASQARFRKEVMGAHNTEMLYSIVLFIVLAIAANSFCITSSRFSDRQAGGLREPLLKDVDPERGEQSKFLAAAEAAPAAAQKQAE